MRAVVQRVSESKVTVAERTTGAIGQGLLVLLGVARGDGTPAADYLSDKIANLRIFEDETGRMNRSLLDVGGKMLVVSQFTLLGDCRKGRRPSYGQAAEPELANSLYEYFVQATQNKGVQVATGEFRAMMKVSLINDGPVTLIIDSKP